MAARTTVDEDTRVDWNKFFGQDVQPVGSVETTVKAILACVVAGLPVVLEGSPGIGKSEMMKALAHAMDAEVLTLYLGEMASDEFAGFPRDDAQHPEENVTVLSEPPWLTRLRRDLGVDINGNYVSPEAEARAKKVVIFLDEINQGDPSVQKTAARMLHEREVGLSKLPPQVIGFIGACNPVEQGIDAYLFSGPFTTRIAYMKMPLDEDRIIEGFLQGGEFAEIKVPRFNEKMIEEINERSKEVMVEYGVFMSQNRKLILLQPKDAESRSQPWANPRQYQAVARAEAACLTMFGKDPDLRPALNIIRKSVIGDVSTRLFETFRYQSTLDNVEDILKDPYSMRIPESPSARIALAHFIAISTRRFRRDMKKSGLRTTEKKKEYTKLLGNAMIAVDRLSSITQGWDGMIPAIGILAKDTSMIGNYNELTELLPILESLSLQQKMGEVIRKYFPTEAENVFNGPMGPDLSGLEEPELEAAPSLAPEQIELGV